MNNSQQLYILNNQAYSNNNDILFENINKLESIINNLNNDQIDIIKKEIANIIIIMRNTINENKKIFEQIKEDIKKIPDKVVQKLSNPYESENNNNNVGGDYINQTKIYNNGKYIGQTINNLREGKGIFYFSNGDRYEGDFKKDLKEGKGIFYI